MILRKRAARTAFFLLQLGGKFLCLKTISTFFMRFVFPPETYFVPCERLCSNFLKFISISKFSVKDKDIILDFAKRKQKKKNKKIGVSIYTLPHSKCIRLVSVRSILTCFNIGVRIELAKKASFGIGFFFSNWDCPYTRYLKRWLSSTKETATNAIFLPLSKHILAQLEKKSYL